MAACIRLCRDVVDLTSMHARFMSRNSAFPAELAAVCADACKVCIEECKQFETEATQTRVAVLEPAVESCRSMAP